MGWGRGYERLILLGGGYSSPSLAGVLGGPPVCQSCGWCLTRLTRLPACRPACCSNVKRQLRAALGERDVAAQRANELTQQLQDKKRQLFSAIQVGARAGVWAGV